MPVVTPDLASSENTIPSSAPETENSGMPNDLTLNNCSHVEVGGNLDGSKIDAILFGTIWIMPASGVIKNEPKLTLGILRVEALRANVACSGR